MKKIWKISLLVVVLFALGACNGEKAHEEVVRLIDELPTVVVLESEEEILAAQAAYNDLSPKDKEKVTNHAKLVEKIDALQTLKDTLAQENMDRSNAASIDLIIAALGEEITIADKADVLAAKAAYDSLDESAKAYVEKYSLLVEMMDNVLLQEQVADALILLLGDEILDWTITDLFTTAPNKEQLETLLEQKETVATTIWEYVVASKTNANQIITHASNLLLEFEESLSETSAILLILDGMQEEVTLDQKEVIEQLVTRIDALSAEEKAMLGDLEKLDRILARLEKLELIAPIIQLMEDFEEEFEEGTLPDSLIQLDQLVSEWYSINLVIVMADTNTKEALQESEWFVSRREKYNQLMVDIGLMLEEVTEVEAKIEALPVIIQLKDEDEIVAIRSLIQAMKDAQMGWISNMERYLTAEGALQQLKDEYASLTNQDHVERTLSEMVAFITSKEFISESVTLPTTSNFYNGRATWTSNNEQIFTSLGVYTPPIFDTTITMTIMVIFRGATASTSVVIEVKSEVTANKWLSIEQFLDLIHEPVITNKRFNTYGFETGYESNPTFHHGNLMFYNGARADIIVDHLSLSRPNRPGTVMTSVEYVTIHDTGSAAPGAGAYAHNQYINTATNVSWHFTIDDKAIYNHIPTNEVAWHAGDGSRAYGLNDSGVKAYGLFLPEVTVSVDGYYELNGHKTNIIAPLAGSVIATTSQLSSNGIRVVVGDNGNWFIGNTYWNSTYRVISNTGGNRNSIGIETCINVGSDYLETMRKTAKVVAELLVEYNLTLNDVVQHNFFSGKNCPQTIREANMWDYFMRMVQIEWFGFAYLSDVEFVWLSNSPYLANNGRVINHPGASADVSYSVQVTYNGEVRTFTFQSRLAPFI